MATYSVPLLKSIVIAAILGGFGLIIIDGMRQLIKSTIHAIVGDKIFESAWFEVVLIASFLLIMWAALSTFPQLNTSHFCISSLAM